jgi:hypothetical protein
MDNIDQDDAHGRLIGILTEALRKAGAEGITKQDVIPAVADFWTPIALIMAGEAGVCGNDTAGEPNWRIGRPGDLRHQTPMRH